MICAWAAGIKSLPPARVIVRCEAMELVKKYWVGVAAVLGGIVLIFNFAKAIGTVMLFLSGVPQAVYEVAFRTYVSVPPLAKQYFQSRLAFTYDDLACYQAFISGNTKGGVITDTYIIVFTSSDGLPCKRDDDQNNWSYAVFSFDKFNLRYTTDISSHVSPGLVQISGHFLLSYFSETGLPILHILQWDGKESFRVVDQFELSYYDAEADASVSYELEQDGDCLVLNAPDGRADPRNPICWLPREKAKEFVEWSDTDLSFDMKLSEAEMAANAIEGTREVYVDSLSRIYAPGRCIPTGGILKWKNFFGSYHLEGRGPGEFSCFETLDDNAAISLKLLPGWN